MEPKDQTVTIMGCTIPRYIDCPWCGQKYACKFGAVTYSIPCDECKATEKYEQQQKNKLHGDAIGQVFKNKQATSVWNYKGRNLYINHKGDIIKDEPYRPLKAGRTK